MSKMRDAMQSQPDELARLLAEKAPAEEAADRLAGRRVRLIGIGTSWHAARHGAWSCAKPGSRPRLCMPPTSRPTGERSTLTTA
jgi:glucosamine--fructose-6-phosphate aminotransferase (isomerizing)